MLLKVLIVVAAVLVVFAILVALRPSDFKVVRSGLIATPPGVPFDRINDFHKWEAWSPWANIDPGMEQTYEGAPAGVGSIYTWTGNSQVGQGRMEIVESRPNERIKIDLQFLKPFPGNCPTEFTFVPEGDETRVTWVMSGRHTFIPKAIGMFMSMDKMIGSQFEKGLEQLRAVCQNSISGRARLPVSEQPHLSKLP